MGMIVFVLRDNLGDFTLNGLSARHDQLTLVNVDGPFQPTADRPAALLQNHAPGCLRIVPAQKHGDEWVKVPYHHAAGGNYAVTSDSRFSEACEKLLGHRFYGAVSIHDRAE